MELVLFFFVCLFCLRAGTAFLGLNSLVWRKSCLRFGVVVAEMRFPFNLIYTYELWEDHNGVGMGAFKRVKCLLSVTQRSISLCYLCKIQIHTVNVRNRVPEWKHPSRDFWV